MRSLSTTLRRKVFSRIQAGDNSINTSLWVSRPTTPLTEDRFLEKQVVLTKSNITKTSVAVCHPKLMRGATDVYIGYLESGIIKIAKTQYVEEMEKHKWTGDIGFSQEADDFCLCFDGTMPKAANGIVEFRTESVPWVFWVKDSTLYGKKINDENAVIIAETNCSKVSAIRAMWSETGEYDFGLIVFFILDGILYYRQLVSGEWMDAEVVTFGPSGVIWSEIAAFRTWDYRVVVQCKATDGTIYELFTQFMGIGKQTSEHIDIRDVKAVAGFDKVIYSNVRNANEHVNVANATAYALMQVATPPVLTSVYNIEDADGDWGTTVTIIFDVPVNGDSVLQNLGAFILVDEAGNEFVPYEVTFDNETNLSATFKFVNINLAFGKCRFVYTPGTVKSIVNTAMLQQEFEFTPQNLEVPDVDPPVPVAARNVDSEGTIVELEFSESLIFGVDGSEANFTVTSPEYKFVPGGEIEQNVKPVVNVKKLDESDDKILILEFGNGNVNNLQNAVGPISIKYADGKLAGYGGQVAAFEFSFMPENLTPKNHPAVYEHVSVTGASAIGGLTKVFYHNASCNEHVNVTDVTATGMLQHINDI